jgi:hypothetical protein
VRVRSSNDGGEASEGGRRQTGMREASGSSEYRWETVSATVDAASAVRVWLRETVAGRGLGEE